MTFISKTFDILKATARPMTFKELAHDIPGSCGETISRACRTLFARGCVTRKPKDPAKPNGEKLWTAIPTAILTTKRASKAPVQPTNAAAPVVSSSGKAFAMCIPANKPTTVIATVQAIQDLIIAKEQFSAHDVTKKVRDMVRDGTANVDDTESGTIHAYGKTLPRIEHEDVKGIVHEYFQTGKMTNYTRVMDGDHWVYKEMAAQPVPVPPTLVALVPTVNGDDYDGEPTL